MSNKEIANTILEQLGGRRFAIMTGAKEFGQTEKGLYFKLPGGKHFKIVLNGNDLYDMSYIRNGRFYKGNYIDAKTLSHRDDICVENMREVFTSMTGLYTSISG